MLARVGEPWKNRSILCTIAEASTPPLASAWILKNASLLILIPSIGLEAVVGGGSKNTSSAGVLLTKARFTLFAPASVHQRPHHGIRNIHWEYAGGGGKLNKNTKVVFCLNDAEEDGHDTSWIWDANFNSISYFENKIYVSANRFDDIALRLKYANVNPSLIVMDGSMRNAIQ